MSTSDRKGASQPTPPDAGGCLEVQSGKRGAHSHGAALLDPVGKPAERHSGIRPSNCGPPWNLEARRPTHGSGHRSSPRRSDSSRRKRGGALLLRTEFLSKYLDPVRESFILRRSVASGASSLTPCSSGPFVSTFKRGCAAILLRRLPRPSQRQSEPPSNTAAPTCRFGYRGPQALQPADGPTIVLVEDHRVPAREHVNAVGGFGLPCQLNRGRGAGEDHDQDALVLRAPR